MSKISLSPNASGTGTFTIASPNGNTDRTINLPDSNGTILTTATAGVPIGGPAGRMYLTTSTALGTSVTKITGFTSDFNYGSLVDTTNSRLNITVSGVYVVAVQGSWSLSSDAALIFLFKNGASINTSQPGIGTGFGCRAVISTVLYLSVGDTLELYSQRGGTACNINSFDTYISASMVRSAT